MEFKQHVGVFNADNQEIGRLERVVIDPKTNEVTHLVIGHGLVAPQAKVLPVDRIEVGSENGIVTRLTPAEFEQLPEFETTQIVTADEPKLTRTSPTDPARSVPTIYWLPAYPNSPLLPRFVEPGYRLETQPNIPAGNVAVKEGARVISRDGKRTGKVDEVLTGAEGDHVTHILISHGLLVKEQKLIPIGWIDALSEDEVHLAVRSSTIDKLPDYDHA